MISKSFKTEDITLVLDESEGKMFIGHNLLLEDDQVIVEQLEKIADKQDEGMKDAETDDNNNNSEKEDEEDVVGIEFTDQKTDPENDENAINFRWSDI